MASMRALECLVTIAEQGSLTKAAARSSHLDDQRSADRPAGQAIRAEPGKRRPGGLAAGSPTAARARASPARRPRRRAVLAGAAVLAGGRRPHPGRLCGDHDRMGPGPGAAELAPPVPRRRAGPAAEYTGADKMLEVLSGGETDIAVGPRPTRTDEHTEVLGREEIVVGSVPRAPVRTSGRCAAGRAVRRTARALQPGQWVRGVGRPSSRRNAASCCHRRPCAAGQPGRRGPGHGGAAGRAGAWLARALLRSHPATGRDRKVH